MGDTNISWATKVWNPVVGCSHVSEGCRNCYAEAMARRLAGRFGYAAPWEPWTASNAAHNVRLRPERLDEPLHWRKSQRVFVCSMSDLFHEQVPDAFLDRVFEKMALLRWHTFLVLTKRQVRALVYLNGLAADLNAWPLPASKGTERIRITSLVKGIKSEWPLPNVWLGVSAEDQRSADERLPILARIPAAVRFWSYEPALGSVDARPWLGCGHRDYDDVICPHCGMARETSTPLDWVIIGGESGPHRRPMQMVWARDLLAQCQTAGVAIWVKQDNGPRPGMQGRFTDAEAALKEVPR